MKIYDLIIMGFANLWQTKLRSVLTILGVVIGIGALSSMISFGTGMQKNVTDALKASDLFSSMNITSAKIDIGDIEHPDPERIADAIKKPGVTLNDSLLEVIKNIEGVEIAHPEIVIPAKLDIGGKSTRTNVQALPVEIGKYKPYNKMLAGTFLKSDTAAGAVLRWETLKRMGFVVKDENKEYILTKKDSANGVRIIPRDSLIGATVRIISAKVDVKKIARNPLMLLTSGEEAFSEDTTEFTITGITGRSGPFETDSYKGGAVIPVGKAMSIPTLGFHNVWDLLGDRGKKNQYSSIYVRVGNINDMSQVRKSLEDMKLNVFSISDQLKELKQGFLIIDSILGAIGIVALLIAALGIINTMVMSILERTREIGIMKAIGAGDREIRTIFIVEAGAIGLIGAFFGLLLGWIFTRIANFVINDYIIPDNEFHIDIFYFPAWLITGAIAFSVLISLAAGLYPVIRASRVDPVKALRHD